MAQQSRTSINLDPEELPTQHSQLIRRETPQYQGEMTGLNPLTDSLATFFHGVAQTGNVILDPVLEESKKEEQRRALLDDVNDPKGETVPQERNLSNWHYYNARIDALAYRTSNDIVTQAQLGAKDLTPGGEVTPDAFIGDVIKKNVSSISDENLRTKVAANVLPRLDMLQSTIRLNQQKVFVQQGYDNLGARYGDMVSDGKMDPSTLLQGYQDYLAVNPSDPVESRRQYIALLKQSVSDKPDAITTLLRNIHDPQVQKTLQFNPKDLDDIETASIKKSAGVNSFTVFDTLSTFETKLAGLETKTDPVGALNEVAETHRQLMEYGFNQGLKNVDAYQKLLGKSRSLMDQFAKYKVADNRFKEIEAGMYTDPAFVKENFDTVLKSRGIDWRTRDGMGKALSIAANVGGVSSGLQANLNSQLEGWESDTSGSAGALIDMINGVALAKGKEPDIVAKELLGDGKGAALWKAVENRRALGMGEDSNQILLNMKAAGNRVTDSTALTPATFGLKPDEFSSKVADAANAYFAKQQPMQFGGVNGPLFNGNVHMSGSARAALETLVMDHMDQTRSTDPAKATQEVLFGGQSKGALLPIGSGGYALITMPQSAKDIVRPGQAEADIAKDDITAVNKLFPNTQDGTLFKNNAWTFQRAGLETDNEGVWNVQSNGIPVSAMPGSAFRYKDRQGNVQSIQLPKDAKGAADRLNEIIDDIVGVDPDRANVANRLFFRPFLPNRPTMGYYDPSSALVLSYKFDTAAQRNTERERRKAEWMSIKADQSARQQETADDVRAAYARPRTGPGIPDQKWTPSQNAQVTDE